LEVFPMSMLEHEDTLHDGEFAGDDAPTWPSPPRVREPAPTQPDDEITTARTPLSSLTLVLGAIGLAAFAMGCSESALEKKNDESVAQTRTITGKLAIAAYDGVLDNPVVYAMSAEDERAYVANVEPSGKFSLTVAADHTYQLTVANRGAGGRLRIVSQVSWRSGAKIRWAKVTGGSSISIGNVRPVGTAAVAAASYGSDGNGSGSESENESSAGTPSGLITSCGGASSTSGSSTDGCYSDLPYDAKLPLGATYFVEQSFWEKGPSPKKIVKVEVEGGWRAAELQSNTPFVVTQADCDHQGNKDKGRDRIFVTWENFDGSTETDHLDMRYCVNEAWPPAQKTLPASCTSAPKPAAPSSSSCEDESGGSVCTNASAMDSECDAPGEAYEPHESSACEEAAKKTDAPCAAKPTPAPTDGPCGCVPEGEVCIENLDCAAGLACFASVCQPAVSSSLR